MVALKAATTISFIFGGYMPNVSSEFASFFFVTDVCTASLSELLDPIFFFFFLRCIHIWYVLAS